ncbi:hypothetical protein IQ226_12575 [Dolichospermum sp. LEGE 00240]|nr:hypothetical protein [Dolichospermum sp. LEGE 00240]MDM3858358.1 hypothetical protein [Aphanizomenon gracile PMC644.10]
MGINVCKESFNLILLGFVIIPVGAYINIYQKDRDHPPNLSELDRALLN